jgi:hypothetical protein
MLAISSYECNAIVPHYKRSFLVTFAPKSTSNEDEECLFQPNATIQVDVN